MGTYQLYLSYHSTDRKEIQVVQQLLEARGITTFMDKNDLPPGLPWPQSLEYALRSVKAVAVFIGPHGLGSWQKREIWFALDRQVQEEKAGRAFPVIPVLLPGADPTPGFLFLNTWIDLRDDLADPEALDALARAARGEAERRPEKMPVTLCPYRGLRAFREEDAAFFFGREAIVQRLEEAVRRQALVALVGSSGSGKSSVVQAGLLPLLRRQHPPAKIWDVVVFTPGDRPFHRLAAALIPLLEPDLSETDRLAEARKLGDRLKAGEVLLEDAIERVLEKLNGTDRLLLVADQFEELFTLTPEADRQLLVGAMLQALERAPLTLVLTLRADFYGHAIALSREFSDRIEEGVVNLGPMTRQELEKVVVEPARRVGLEFERGLEERILDDVGEEPGNLPLLEFALTELWVRRQAGRLTHAAYEEIGKIKGAIARWAEEELEKFTPEQQVVARWVFTRLVRVARPEEGTEDTRRRATLKELETLGVSKIAEVRPVIKALADARLVVTGRDEVTGEETVEVAHEALIRGWERLRHWLDEDREFLLWRQRLRVALEEWKRTKRDEGALLHGAPLTEAERWLAERAEELSQDERAFIEESRVRRKKEEKRWRELYEEAERQRQIALARQLAAQAELVRRQRAYLLVRSVLLAVESLRRFPTLEGDQALRYGLALLPRPMARMQHGGWVYSVAFSPDGNWLAGGSKDGTARIWEVATGQSYIIQHEGPVVAVVFSPNGRWLATGSSDGTASVWSGRWKVASMWHKGPVRAIAFSPDGKWLATGSEDGTAQVWDAATGQRVACMQHEGTVRAVAFSPDGWWLATGSDDNTTRVWEVASGQELVRMQHNSEVLTIAFSPDGQWLGTGSSEGIARIWDMASGREVVRMQHGGEVLAVAFSPDGIWLATGNGDYTARVWDVVSGREVARMQHDGPVRTIVFSPDGKWLATGSDDKTARVWDVATNQEVARMQHEDRVRAVVFSPDGKWLATGSDDKTAWVWEVIGGQEVACMQHKDTVKAVAFSPDGKWLATGSLDGTARVWDVSSRREIARMQHEWSVLALAFSPDGEWLATGSGDYTARIWKTVTGLEVVCIQHKDEVLAVTFSPNGRWLATGSEDGTVQIWDGVSRQEVARMQHDNTVRVVAFSPDGKWLATGSDDKTARVWDVSSGREVARIQHGGWVRAVAFSPDGRWLVTGGEDCTVRVWEAATRRKVTHMQHNGPVLAVAFSPDGRWLATGSRDHTARVWDVTSGQEVARMQHEGWVYTLAFSPDGKWLATGSADCTARVWEAATGREMARMQHKDCVETLAFSPDGKWLATGSKDGTARVWLWRPEDLIAEACSRLTRNLTHEEWRRYLGDEPYRPTCPNLPVPEE